ncbi:hypothetical protein H5410_019157 [Solanum commersonii]|uniref:DUF4371 domain-containing protein n=1 Tax=Solanum commersonii TaxID=4109 RepID=A0A9J6A455_SOLCO|nr:hypothetical protein H5410_019157 [Solanum commersonii]
MKAFIKVESSGVHNRAKKKCEDLMRQEQSIQAAFVKLSNQTKLEHKIRLKASIEVARLLLNQELAFRGHREDESSLNKGNFLEILSWYAAKGLVVERFIGIIHVHDTSALCLKEAIVNYLATFFEFIFYTGQCYDGASNMQGRLSGLKWEVLLNVWMNFENLKQKVQVALDMGEVESGKGLNQELGLARANTLGSHYKSFKNFISMFGSITDVLDTIVVDSESLKKKLRQPDILKFVKHLRLLSYCI